MKKEAPKGNATSGVGAQWCDDDDGVIAMKIVQERISLQKNEASESAALVDAPKRPTKDENRLKQDTEEPELKGTATAANPGASWCSGEEEDSNREMMKIVQERLSLQNRSQDEADVGTSSDQNASSSKSPATAEPKMEGTETGTPGANWCSAKEEDSNGVIMKIVQERISLHSQDEAAVGTSSNENASTSKILEKMIANNLKGSVDEEASRLGEKLELQQGQLIPISSNRPSSPTVDLPVQLRVTRRDPAAAPGAVRMDGIGATSRSEDVEAQSEVEETPVPDISPLVQNGDLVSANPVTEEDDPEDIPNAMHWDEEEKVKASQERRCQGNLKVLIALGFGAILVVVVALAIALARKGGESTAASVVQATSSPSAVPPPPEVMLQQHVLNLLPNGTAEAALYELDSPQAKAFDWLLSDPYAASYSDMRLVQRFALAAIFYSTGGEDKWYKQWLDDKNKKHTLDHWMSYEKHECEWSMVGLLDEIFYDIEDVLQHPIPESPCASHVLQISEGAEFAYETLWLSSNSLVGESIPQEIFMLTSLKVLNLQYNEISGSVPTEVGLLTNLEALAIGGNPLTGSFPTEIGLCTNLTTLILDYNHMSGQIPSEIANLKQLKFLFLEHSGLTGSLPSLPDSIWEVQFGGNLLTGQLSTDIGLLPKLKTLHIHENSFTGTIPTEIGLLPSLLRLWLRNNNFTSTIPSEIGGISTLDKMTLRSNPGLIGPIPSEIGMLTHLSQVWLYETSVSSTLPSEIGDLEMLQELWLYDTDISGTIPFEIALLSNLEVLLLNQNKLSRRIPTEIGTLEALVDLDLSYNELSGELPSEIGLIPNLAYFDVSGNFLSGEVPQEVAPMLDNVHLWMFNLSGNNFTGLLSEEFCVADDLFYFDCGTELCGCSCACANATG